MEKKPETLISCQTTEGVARAPHRSLFYAMGYSPDDLQKPMIGIANAFNEIIPGHIHLRDLAQAAKLGVAAAGGTPVEFPVIGICDGIAMNHDGMKYPLASRELIADSIETMAVAHKFDGLVLIGNAMYRAWHDDGSLPAEHPLRLCRRGPMLTAPTPVRSDLVRGLFGRDSML